MILYNKYLDFSDDKIFKKFQKHPDVYQQIEGWQERNGQTILLKDGENVERIHFFEFTLINSI